MNNNSHDKNAVTLSVEVLERERAADVLADDVADLAGRALERNPFYEPPMLIPALQLIDPEQPLAVVCVRDGRRLAGLFVLQHSQVRDGVPIAVLRSWLHRYCFLSTPLLDAELAPAVLGAFADWVESGAAPASSIEFPLIHHEGRVARLLAEVMIDNRGWIADVVTSQRALLSRERIGASTISGRHAKELRRLERRLADRGVLSYDELQPDAPAAPWMEEFIALEASGWKGREGTAIGQRETDREYFMRLAELAHARGDLQFIALRIDGAPIAMMLNMFAGERGFALKIAYDESFARYSPGVLLERFCKTRLAETPRPAEWMDSCAHEGHQMIERLWPDRCQIAAMTLAGRGMTARAFLAVRRALRTRLQAARRGGFSLFSTLVTLELQTIFSLGSVESLMVCV